MKNKFGIKEVVAAGIGTALFIVLTEVQIPVGIPNTYLQPRMAILAFMSAVYGPIVGTIIGLVGHVLGDCHLLWQCLVELGLPRSSRCHSDRHVLSQVCSSAGRF